MGDWTKPRPISAPEIAFPASVIGKFMPSMEEIPEDFKRMSNPWNKLASTAFFHGLGKGVLVAKDGIDERLAIQNLRACLGSFEPQHEHKEAAVGYLMSLWFHLAEPAQ